MRLSFRPAKVEDLPACCRLLLTFGRGHYDEAILRALPDLWEALLAQKALSISVFEDEDLPPGQRLQGLGTGVFVGDAVCEQWLADPKPYLANQIYRSCLEGRPLVLDGQALRRANAAGGVNLLPLDFALAERDLTHPKVFPLLAVVWEAFHFCFYGYRLHRIVQEVFGADWREFLEAAGLSVYAEFRGLPEPRPFLMGTSREDFQRRAGSRYTFFFTAPPPRFQFRASEQALLGLALRNLSDEQAAGELGISLHTVKKLWRDIFERIEDTEPGWFSTQRPARDHRGPEKRRYLIDYLAHHLEELRPWRRGGS